MATAATGLGHDESVAASALDQRLWHGHIPVVFSLHPSEVTTLHAPRPFYVRPLALATVADDPIMDALDLTSVHVH